MLVYLHNCHHIIVFYSYANTAVIIIKIIHNFSFEDPTLEPISLMEAEIQLEKS
jgi:hypothetical protein